MAWPTTVPTRPGNYASNWRASYRPNIDGWAKDGVTGPLQTDEFGTTYPARVNGSTVAALGTAASPVLITYDRINGWKSSAAGGTLLSSVLSSTYVVTEAGLQTLKNVDVVGRVVLDGGYEQIKFNDIVVTSTHTDTTIQAGLLNTHDQAITSAGFPGVASVGTGPAPGGRFYCVIMGVLCTIDYATSNTLKGLASADGLSHLLFLGTQALYADSTGAAATKCRMRNVRCIHPLAANLAQVQTTLAADHTISALAGRTQIASGGTVAIGTAPTSVSLVSTTTLLDPAITGNAVEYLLIGDDFVSYTGKTSSSITGVTWLSSGGVSSQAWLGQSGVQGSPTAKGIWVYQGDQTGLTMTLTNATGLPTTFGCVEIDAQVEVHYRSRTGNVLSGLCYAARWSSQVATYPTGMDVRSFQGAAGLSMYNANSEVWGCLSMVGVAADVRDCVFRYGSKGPGAFRAACANGSKLAHCWFDGNYYDVAHIYEDVSQFNATNCVFVTSCGTGNEATPHTDGFQGWACRQNDATPVAQDCAFIGSLTNSHEFWNAQGTTTSSVNSNMAIPTDMVFQNCLLGASPAGGFGGKGGLIDESLRCGAKNCWYDTLLVTHAPQGPFGITAQTTATAVVGATSIAVDATTVFTVGTTWSTTLVSDTVVSADTSGAVLSGLTTLSVTNRGANCPAANPIAIFLDDGTKQCALRADYSAATGTLNNIRWLGGTGGTYTAAGTTVWIPGTSDGGVITVGSKVSSRLMVLRYTNIGVNTLNGISPPVPFQIDAGSFIAQWDGWQHPAPTNVVDISSQYWGSSGAGGWLPGVQLSDNGLLPTLSDSIFKQKAFGRQLTDTGLPAITDSTSRRLFSHPALLDTGIAFGESLVRETATRPRSMTDNGLAFSDTLGTVHTVTLTDNGLATVTDSAKTAVPRTVTDTGLATITDSIVRGIGVGRLLTDTGLATISDSTSRHGVFGKVVTDTGLATITDSVSAKTARTFVDTGLSTITDAVVRSVRFGASVTDTGLAVITDSTARQKMAFRAFADTGLSLSDTAVRGTAQAVSDTGLAVSDTTKTQLKPGIVDFGLGAGVPYTFNTSWDLTVGTLPDGALVAGLLSGAGTAVHVYASWTDTTGIAVGTTVFESTAFPWSFHPPPFLYIAGPGGITTYAVSAANLWGPGATSSIENFGVTYVSGPTSIPDGAKVTLHADLNDAIRRSVRLSSITDTGLVFSDVLVHVGAGIRTVSDTGLALSESLSKQAVVRLTDTGLSVADSAHLTPPLRTATDTLTTITDFFSSLRSRSLLDTGLSLTDVVGLGARFRGLVERGLLISDTLTNPFHRSASITDFALNLTDGIFIARIVPPPPVGFVTTSDLPGTKQLAGRTSVGSEMWELATDSKVASWVAMPQPSLLSKVSFWLDGFGSGGVFATDTQALKAVVYDDGDQLVAVSNEVVIKKGQLPGWVDFRFDFPTGIPPSLSRPRYQAGLLVGGPVSNLVRFYGDTPHGIGGASGNDTYADGPTQSFGARLTLGTRYPLLVSGNEITDAKRQAATLWTVGQQGGQTDGAAIPGGVGAWQGATNWFGHGQADTAGGYSVANTGQTAPVVDTVRGAPFSPNSIKTVCDGSVAGQGISMATGTGLGFPPGALLGGEAWFIGAAGLTYNVNFKVTHTDATVNAAAQNQFVATGSWQRVRAELTTVAGTKTGDKLTMTITSNTPTAATMYFAHGMLASWPSVSNDQQGSPPYIATSGGAPASSLPSRVQLQAPPLSPGQMWVAVRLSYDYRSSHAFGLARGVFDWGDATNRVRLYANGTPRWTVERRVGGVSTILQNTGVAVGATWNFFDHSTIIGAWEPTQLKLSLAGQAFTTQAASAIPTLSAFNADLLSVGGSGFLGGRCLWMAFGTGVLSNADAAKLNSYGDTPPNIGQLQVDLSAGATPTLMWPAVDGNSYKRGPSPWTDMSGFITLTAPYEVTKANVDDFYYGRLPLYESQSVFAAGAPLSSPLFPNASLGWHGTSVDPDQGVYALVRSGSVLESLVGERVKITRADQSRAAVYAFVRGHYPILEDISVSRQLFSRLGTLAADELKVKVEVIA